MHGTKDERVPKEVGVQRELAERNTELMDNRRMDFRIGINPGAVMVIGMNLGAVMVKGDEIYADGVNVAARLESPADAGGICISRSAYDQVESKPSLECDYLGEQQVKNIAKPVRAYSVSLTPSAVQRAVRSAPLSITC